MSKAQEKNRKYYADWLARRNAGKEEQTPPMQLDEYERILTRLQAEIADIPEISAILLRTYALDKNIPIDTVYKMIAELGYHADEGNKNFTKYIPNHTELPPSRIEPPQSPPPTVIVAQEIPRPQRGRAPNSDGQYDDPLRRS